MTEIWKDIEGYEGLYQVSNLGRVKSFPRNGTTKNEKILKHLITASGYHKVHLSKNNVVQTFSVARLVGFAFPEICGEYFDDAQINHLNEKKDINTAENLRWTTHIENQNWGTKISRSSKANTNGKCSKPVICYNKNGEYVAEYPSINEAYRQTGIDHTLIGRCCNDCHKNKTAGGYIWKYNEKSGAA